MTARAAGSGASPGNRTLSLRTERIDRIFAAAEAEGRAVLLEHEAYALLREAGIAVPRFLFVPKGGTAAAADVAALGTSEVVLKIVSPLILHKSDVGGVEFAPADAAAVNRACARMLAEVPRRYAAWARKPANAGAGPAPSAVEAADSIRGVLVCERVRYTDVGFGSELLAGLRNSREFGPVVSLGSGGLDVEFMAGRMREGRAVAVISAHRPPDDPRGVLEPLAVFGKLAAEFRGRKAVLPPRALTDLQARFARLGRAFSPFAEASPYVIEDLEVNPFVVRDGRLVPLDALARFSRAKQAMPARPAAMIHQLLRPETIGIIGVSEKMNIGRIILRNVLASGFPRDSVYVVKPGLPEIDGCACVPSIADLPRPVDMFVLTLAAEQCPPVMSDLIAHEKARSVILIAGGMGEKSGGASIEERLRDMLADGRRQGRLTPVVNGGNCLGIASRPGRYDTTFIPEWKLPRPRGLKSGLVFVSQSGAFMICRMSSWTRIEPLYAVSLGNQLDLTVSDYLEVLGGEPEAETFAVYMEGFRTGDGLAFARAAAAIARRPGKTVIVYKAGRSEEGRTATSSHTASVAGDYAAAKALLEQSGAWVAADVLEFESLVKGAVYLKGKAARGNRIGLMSNAGFECVLMADALAGEEGRLELADLSAESRARITGLLKPLGIDRLQDVRNPLDVTPVADDAVFIECARAVLEDPGVDCAVISPVPMTPAMQTLPSGAGRGEDFARPGGFGRRIVEIFQASRKPFVINVDAGILYDPLAGFLEAEGLPVFRRADQAMRFMRRFAGR